MLKEHLDSLKLIIENFNQKAQDIPEDKSIKILEDKQILARKLSIGFLSYLKDELRNPEVKLHPHDIEQIETHYSEIIENTKKSGNYKDIKKTLRILAHEYDVTSRLLIHEQHIKGERDLHHQFLIGMSLFNLTTFL